MRSTFFVRVVVCVWPGFVKFEAFFDDASDENDIFGVKFCEISLFCKKIRGLTKKWCALCHIYQECVRLGGETIFTKELDR